MIRCQFGRGKSRNQALLRHHAKFQALPILIEKVRIALAIIRQVKLTMVGCSDHDEV